MERTPYVSILHFYFHCRDTHLEVELAIYKLFSRSNILVLHVSPLHAQILNCEIFSLQISETILI